MYVHTPDDEQYIIYIFHESDKFEIYLLQNFAKKVLILLIKVRRVREGGRQIGHRLSYCPIYTVHTLSSDWQIIEIFR
jgi:hypothetical protein